MEPEAAPEVASSPRSGLARWTTSDRVLMAMVVGLFLVNIIVSFALPPTVQWSGGRLQHYLIHMAMALSGLLLVVVPASVLASMLRREVFEGAAAPLFLWFVATIAMATVVLSFRDVRAGRRVAYAYLIGAQITGFAAVHWSTLGS